MAALSLLFALTWRGCAPAGGGGLVTGRVVGALGSGTIVLLVDPPAGVGVRLSVGPDGGFSVRVPPGAQDPWVVVDSQQGALVQSKGVDPGEGATLPPMALWATDVRARAQDGRVRIDWSPIPLDREGFPARVRYSVLVSYERTDGASGEATFPTREAVLELDIAEEVVPYLPNLDPAKPELEVIVRAFDPEDPIGPMWIGGRVKWRVPPPG